MATGFQLLKRQRAVEKYNENVGVAVAVGFSVMSFQRGRLEDADMNQKKD
jgi:hypothetical protein